MKSPQEHYIKFVRDVINSLEVEPFYARTDCIEDQTGALRLMELELIEPKLFFAHSEEAVRQFVAGIMAFPANHLIRKEKIPFLITQFIMAFPCR